MSAEGRASSPRTLFLVLSATAPATAPATVHRTGDGIGSIIPVRGALSPSPPEANLTDPSTRRQPFSLCWLFLLPLFLHPTFANPLSISSSTPPRSASQYRSHDYLQGIKTPLSPLQFLIPRPFPWLGNTTPPLLANDRPCATPPNRGKSQRGANRGARQQINTP